MGLTDQHTRVDERLLSLEISALNIKNSHSATIEILAKAGL